MVRSFTDAPVAPESLDRILDAAHRAPSAGFTQGVEFVVLDGSEQTNRYWQVTLPDEDARSRFPWPGLLTAPVLVVVIVDPGSYLQRYADADKARTGLGESADRWPVPYWWVDAGMVAMTALLAAVDEGLGALFFGLFDDESAVLRTLRVPSGYRGVGSIAIGHPELEHRPGGSAVTRRRRPIRDLVHRGGW